MRVRIIVRGLDGEEAGSLAIHTIKRKTQHREGKADTILGFPSPTLMEQTMMVRCTLEMQVREGPGTWSSGLDAYSYFWSPFSEFEFVLCSQVAEYGWHGVGTC
jgi:hypothetical protein